MTFPESRAIISLVRDARVVELADSLDSGSSAHYGRAGSSPASRTKQKTLEAARLRGFFISLERTNSYTLVLPGVLQNFQEAFRAAS